MPSDYKRPVSEAASVFVLDLTSCYPGFQLPQEPRCTRISLPPAGQVS